MKLPKRINWYLVILPILIFSLGLITLYSTAPDLAGHQLVFFAISYIVFIGVSLLDYKILSDIWKPIYIITVVMLVLVFVLGQQIFGSSRWLEFGPFNLQPSEFAKITTVITIATLVFSNKNFSKDIKYLLRVGVFMLLLFVLVFLQPDLGTSLIIFSVTLGVFWFAGLDKKFYLGGLILFGLLSTPVWNLLRDYQKERILTFLNPGSDVLGSGYNVIQSTIAIGSGQVFGKGFRRGTQSHLKFLPVFWTDFIFAAFAEEWGFIGVVGLLILYFALLSFILYIAVSIKDELGSLITIGIFIVIFLQFIINVGMNLGIMPVTGVPLPLVSYGGSSLLSTMIMLGIVHSVWIHEKI